MSAYVVDPEHIHMLVHAAVNRKVSYYHDNQSYPVRSDTAGYTGAVLLAENLASVNHRYCEHELEPAYEYRQPGRSATPVEVLKGLDCYEYQACEHPDWAGSQAKAFCDALRDAAISDLPGYDEAPWEWTA